MVRDTSKETNRIGFIYDDSTVPIRLALLMLRDLQYLFLCVFVRSCRPRARFQNGAKLARGKNKVKFISVRSPRYYLYVHVSSSTYCTTATTANVLSSVTRTLSASVMVLPGILSLIDCRSCRRASRYSPHTSCSVDKNLQPAQAFFRFLAQNSNPSCDTRAVRLSVLSMCLKSCVT